MGAATTPSRLVEAHAAALRREVVVWGKDDEFQRIDYARRNLDIIPNADLVEMAGKHIPIEDHPDALSAAIEQHLVT